MEEMEDEVQHDKLLSSLRSLDASRISKSKHQLRSEPIKDVSEFHLQVPDGKKLSAQDLLNSIHDVTHVGDIRKQLSRTKQRNKVISAPLHRQANEKVQRVVAYQSVSKELSKWDPVVHRNRLADQLVFPLNEVPFRIRGTDEAVKQYEPRTKLEKEMAAVLGQSKNNLTNDVELTQAEKEIVKAMSLREAKERRAAVQKMRALISYQEAKLKRKSRIKSKRYHRILKRQKRKQLVKDFEELREKDPEAAAEKLDLLDRDRIQERMSLKHRGTGKWAKEIRKAGFKDPQTREAFQAQLRLGKELREKRDDDVSDAESDPELATAPLDLIGGSLAAGSSSNPWLQSDLQKLRAQIDAKRRLVTVDEFAHAQLGPEVLGAKKSGPLVSAQEDLPELEDIPADVGSTCHMSESTSNDTEKVAQSDAKLSAKKSKRKRESAPVVAASKISQSPAPKKLNLSESLTLDSLFDEAISAQQAELASDDFVGESVGATKGSKKSRKRKNAKNSDSASEAKSSDTLKNVAPLAEEEECPDRPGVDPKKFLKAPHGLVVPYAASLVHDFTDDANDRNAALIAEAFADDDIVADFEAEKAAVLERDKPKDIDLNLPGWGSWAGADIKAKPKKQRFILKAPPTEPRRDRFLPGVIISEAENKAIKKLQVDEVPFPFTSVEDYEASLRHPLGREWNPALAHRKLVEPSIVTKRGAIIKPMDKTQAFQKKKRRNSTGGFDSDNDDSE